jgi:hypothetical protein
MVIIVNVPVREKELSHGKTLCGSLIGSVKMGFAAADANAAAGAGGQEALVFPFKMLVFLEDDQGLAVGKRKKDILLIQQILKDGGGGEGIFLLLLHDKDGLWPLNINTQQFPFLYEIARISRLKMKPLVKKLVPLLGLVFLFSGQTDLLIKKFNGLGQKFSHMEIVRTGLFHYHGSYPPALED